MTGRIRPQPHAGVLRRRTVGGLPGAPQASSDPVRLLSDDLLDHLEKGGPQGPGDDHSALSLGHEVLGHLEEWKPGDPLPPPEESVQRESRVPPSDRAHPLWDSDLDG